MVYLGTDLLIERIMCEIRATYYWGALQESSIRYQEESLYYLAAEIGLASLSRLGR